MSTKRLYALDDSLRVTWCDINHDRRVDGCWFEVINDKDFEESGGMFGRDSFGRIHEDWIGSIWFYSIPLLAEKLRRVAENLDPTEATNIHKSVTVPVRFTRSHMSLTPFNPLS